MTIYTVSADVSYSGSAIISLEIEADDELEAADEFNVRIDRDSLDLSDVDIDIENIDIISEEDEERTYRCEKTTEMF